MPVDKHDPDWIEDYNVESSTRTIYFRCRICGARTNGSREAYEKGKWLPSMSQHR